MLVVLQHAFFLNIARRYQTVSQLTHHILIIRRVLVILKLLNFRRYLWHLSIRKLPVAPNNLLRLRRRAIIRTVYIHLIDAPNPIILDIFDPKLRYLLAIASTSLLNLLQLALLALILHLL